MKNLLMGCTVALLLALTARTEARPPDSINFEKCVAPKVAECPTKSELGIAGWYGEECQGNPTASGELFDMNDLTAAHRTLPMGIELKVTNVGNNRSVMVRINDRGPFIHKRMLDVSMAAARKLGFEGAGLALVRTQVVSYPKASDPN